jgi:hypothetical protein
MKPLRLPAALGLLLALAGCQTLMSGLNPEIGSYGGPQIGVDLQGVSGKVDFDCASGTIDEPVFLAKDSGAFSVKGTYRTGQAGPIKVGQIFTSQPATYAGTIVEEDMTMAVTLEDGSTLGPYTLRRGAPPQLIRCL